MEWNDTKQSQFHWTCIIEHIYFLLVPSECGSIIIVVPVFIYKLTMSMSFNVCVKYFQHPINIHYLFAAIGRECSSHTDYSREHEHEGKGNGVHTVS
jgi:hypothetical protein